MLNDTRQPLPQNDSQLNSAVREQLSLEANDAERSIWPSLKAGAVIVGGLLFVMAFVPLLLNLLPRDQISALCLRVGANDIANIFRAFRADCSAGGMQAHVPILSFFQMILMVIVFFWAAVVAVIALLRERRYVSRFGHQHLLPIYWGYGAIAGGLGVIAAAACLMAYSVWLLMTPGFGFDNSRPIVLRTQTYLQSVYYAWDSLIFALAGIATAVAIYWIAMTSYCMFTQLRQKLRRQA